MTKTCSKCNETKELTEFYKDSRLGTRYRPSCKLCFRLSSIRTPEQRARRAKISAEYYQKNKEKIIQYSSEYYYQNKKTILKKMSAKRYEKLKIQEPVQEPQPAASPHQPGILPIGQVR